MGEVAGPIGQLQAGWSPGYGFTAIIVVFVGRLHPIGIVLASLLMALLYLGGEAVQTSLQLPQALAGVFQGLLLFCLLGCRSVRQLSRATPGFRASRGVILTFPDSSAETHKMDIQQASTLASSAVVAAIPLMFAGAGELVAEKSGVLNLGVEGMMLMGAVTGYAVTAITGSPWLGVSARRSSPDSRCRCCSAFSRSPCSPTRSRRAFR